VPLLVAFCDDGDSRPIVAASAVQREGMTIARQFRAVSAGRALQPPGQHALHTLCTRSAHNALHTMLCTMMTNRSFCLPLLPARSTAARSNALEPSLAFRNHALRETWSYAWQAD